MTTTPERIDALHAELAELEAVASAEAAASKAKDAYRDNPTEKNKAKHREAATALSDARAEQRKNRPISVVTDDK